MTEKETKKIVRVVAVFCSIFVFVLCACFYKEGIVPGLNKEIDESKKTAVPTVAPVGVKEGIFYDRNGTPLTEVEEGADTAQILNDEVYAPIIGINSSRIGCTGLRRTLSEYVFPSSGRETQGADVTLTIDDTLQQAAYEAIDGEGSVTVLNAKTGEILALASRSSADVAFKANCIDDLFRQDKESGVEFYYSDLYNSIDGFYQNRAVYSGDPPGSTAKVMTAGALILNGMEDYTVHAKSSIDVGGLITNFGGMDIENCSLQIGLNDSVNTFFAQAAIALGRSKLQEVFESYLVGDTIELDFCYMHSNLFNKDESVDRFKLGSTGYGQADLIMCPLHIACVFGSIENDGKLQRPYMVQQVVTSKGREVVKAKEKTLSRTIGKSAAAKLSEHLHETATHGGAYFLYDEFDEKYYFISKTGTAETSRGEDHIFYAVGVVINDVPYAVVIDKLNADKTGSSLRDNVIEVVTALINTVDV